GNIEDLKAAGVKKIVTSCPHCVKTIGADYAKFGYQVEIVHSSVFVEELLRDAVGTEREADGKEREADGKEREADGKEREADGKEREALAERQTVTYHDPCYLGRYGGIVDEPRALLTRFGADIREPERNRDNPYCCGAGGGLLFADKEEEPGSRISDVRFKQLQATGAGTVGTACPFCSIMLKGAQASAGADTQFVDLMTFVNGKLQPRA